MDFRTRCNIIDTRCVSYDELEKGLISSHILHCDEIKNLRYKHDMIKKECGRNEGLKRKGSWQIVCAKSYQFFRLSISCSHVRVRDQWARNSLRVAIHAVNVFPTNHQIVSTKWDKRLFAFISVKVSKIWAKCLLAGSYNICLYRIYVPVSFHIIIQYFYFSLCHIII